MKRRVVAVVAAIGLVAGACGGNSGASCEEIADQGIALVQDLIDEVDSMSLDELTAQMDDAGFLGDFEQRAEELDAEAASAGCGEEELAQLVEERVGDLDATTEFGQALLDGVTGELFGG